jgi:hypothetical protein
MSSGAGSDELRHLAASILSERRFRGAPLGQPLHSELHQIEHWLAGIASAARHFPGGAVVFWAVLAALVLSAAVWLTRRSLSRLAPAPPAGHAALAGRGGEDPRALDADADAAEQRGAFADAVRLRFRAGLLALGARGAIEYRSSLRTVEVSRRLESDEFDGLARTFERVAYGDGTASETDATAARDGWRRVLAGAGR